MQPAHGPAWAPEATATYWINRASRVLSRRLDAELRSLGFALGQMPVLRALAGGESRSQAELARIAEIEQPSMAETLARMVRDGVVDRHPDPRDGRAFLISLSRRSQKQLTRARRAVMAVDAKAMAGVSGEELAAICAVLQRIVHNLERLAVDDAASARERPTARNRRRPAKPLRKDDA